MNPNQIVSQMLKNNPAIKNNPMMQNALQMAQQGNEQGLQQLVQNVAKSKGINLNELQEQVRSRFGL